MPEMNSGATPQPGGYALVHEPVIANDDGGFSDAAVADDLTETQVEAAAAKVAKKKGGTASASSVK